MNEHGPFRSGWRCVVRHADQPHTPAGCLYEDPSYKVVKRTIPVTGHEDCGFRDATGRVIPFNGNWFKLWQ